MTDQDRLFVVVTPWASAQLGPQCVQCVTEDKSVAETVAAKYDTFEYDHALTVGSDVPRAIIYEAPTMDAEAAEDHEPDAPKDLVEQARDLVTQQRADSDGPDNNNE